MALGDGISVVHVRDEEARGKALEVLRSVYREEKRWVGREEEVLPSSDLTGDGVCWFLVSAGDEPVGVVRVLYELPLELYRQYGFTLLDTNLDIESFLKRSRIAEVGRFAVLPRWRGKIIVAAALMRAATTETVRRGFTHFITDVFENDPHSPYAFHTRVLGFEPVATHEHGELATKGRRITMLLDLKAAYQRLRKRRSWIFRYITEGWDNDLLVRVADAAG